MNAIILLQGYLTGERLREIVREIARYKELAAETETLKLCFAIASHGGEAKEALDFVDWIEKTGLHLTTKIYRAESAAALIAMTAHEREMVRNGIFTINLGSAEINSDTLITPEKVPTSVIEEAQKLRTRTFSAMSQCGIPKTGTYMDTLLAQNQLTLTARECLELGIVSRII